MMLQFDDPQISTKTLPIRPLPLETSRELHCIGPGSVFSPTNSRTSGEQTSQFQAEFDPPVRADP